MCSRPDDLWHLLLVFAKVPHCNNTYLSHQRLTLFTFNYTINKDLCSLVKCNWSSVSAQYVVQRARSRSQRLRHNQWSQSTNSTANQSTNSYVSTRRRKRCYSYSNYKLNYSTATANALHYSPSRKRRAFEHQQHSANPYQLPLCDVTRCHTHQRFQPPTDQCGA